MPFRRTLLSLLVASSAMAEPSGPRLHAVLGSADLSAPARMLELTFLDGGNLLLALDATGTAQLWNVQHGERRGLVFGPVLLTPAGLQSAPPGRGCLLDGPQVLLEDGRLARAGRGSLRLCDVSGRTPDVDIPVNALTEDGTALAVAAGGTRLAQGTAFGEVILAQAGAETLHLEAHEGRVLALHLLPDGQLLTAGADGTIRAYDSAGRRLRSVEGMPAHKRSHPSGCEGETPVVAAFAPDGSAVVLSTLAGDGLEACPDAPVPARLRLLDLPRGTVRWELKGVQASAASFSPDGTLAVAVALRPGEPGDANPSTVVRLDTRTGAPLDRTAGHQAPLTVLRFSPDGSTLLSGDAAGTWKRWAVATGQETSSATQGEGAILDLRLTRDQKVLTQHEDDTVRQWSPTARCWACWWHRRAARRRALSPACRAEEEKTKAALAGMRPRPSPLRVRDPGHYAGVTVYPELALSPDGETCWSRWRRSPVSASPTTAVPAAVTATTTWSASRSRTGRSIQVLPVDEELLGGCVPPAGAFVTRADRAE